MVKQTQRPKQGNIQDNKAESHLSMKEVNKAESHAESNISQVKE